MAVSIVGEIKKNKLAEEFIWTIENFSTDKYLYRSPLISSVFTTPDDLYMELYPHGTTDMSKGYISIFIVTNKQDIFQLRVRFSILNDKMEKLNSANEFRFENRYHRRGYEKFSSHSFINDAKNKVLNDNKLTIMCEIYSREFDTGINFINRIKEFNDFENLLCNDMFADATLRIDEKNLPVHKVILSSRSSVFRAMFEHDMQESTTNLVIIEDIKYTTMKELLRFIYCGKIKSSNEISLECLNLLMASNKYDIKGLKNVCESYLCKTLNKQNACKYLELSNQYEAEELKTHAINYIVKNSNAIVALPNFNTITATWDASLLLQLVRAFCVKK